MRKIFLILLLTICAGKLFSQEYLNKSKTDIKAILAGKDGELRRELKSIGQPDIDIRFDELIYFFPDSARLANGIYMMLIKFDNDRCFEYTVNYSGAKFKTRMVAKFDNPSSGLKRKNKKLEWQNTKKRFDLGIYDIFNNSIAMPGGVPTDRFTVEVNKTDKRYQHKEPEFFKQIDSAIKAARKE
jgi:hypothetical protein